LARRGRQKSARRFSLDKAADGYRAIIADVATFVSWASNGADVRVKRSGAAPA